jgi:hypothetical protein
MSLEPTLVRTSAIALIVAAGTDAGTNVIDSRADRQGPPDDLPAVDVYTDRFRGEEGRSLSAPKFRGIEELVILCHATVPTDQGGTITEAAKDADCALRRDRLELQVLNALFEDVSWIQQYEYIRRMDITRDVWSDGARRVGTSRIQLDLQFHARWQFTSIDDLDVIHIEQDLDADNPDTTDVVTDVDIDQT